MTVKQITKQNIDQIRFRMDQAKDAKKKLKNWD